MIRRWWRVERKPRHLRFPEVCACCGAEPAEVWEPLEVPYCAPCRRHTPRLGPMALGLIAGAAGALAAYAAYRGLPLSPLPVHVFVALGGALLVLLPWWLWRKARPLGAEHVLRAQAVERVGEATLFAHGGYAERVAALNEVTARQVAPPLSLLLELGVPVLVLVGLLVGTSVLYDKWHLPLWVDNATGRAVTVDAEGRVLGEVLAGQRASWSVPARTLRLRARVGSQVIDAVRIERPVSNGVWIFNVAARRCYEIWSRTYKPGGGFSLVPNRSSRRIGEHLFHAASTYLFQEPPRQIRVRKSSARIFGVFGVRRVGLRVIPCRR